VDPRLLAVAEQQLGVFSGADAARVDVGDTALRRLTARGEVVRVRRSAYILGRTWSDASPEGRLALRTRAVLRSRDKDAASHQSALAVHGLPLHGVRLDVVDTQSAVSRVRLSAGLRTQPGGAPTTTVSGCRCVTVPHAIAQVLHRSGLLAALVPLDRALRTKVCSLEQVAAALDDVRGKADALGRRLLELADPTCDSVGETRTRLLLHDLGFTPLTQISIHDHHDSFVARVDFLVDKRVVVEFDGLQKYAGADGRAALAREKAREDRLRALGYVVVRLTWADLDRPAKVAEMMRRAIAQAQRPVS